MPYAEQPSLSLPATIDPTTSYLVFPQGGLDLEIYSWVTISDLEPSWLGKLLKLGFQICTV